MVDCLYLVDEHIQIAGVAQSAEHVLGKDGVTGSIPVSSLSEMWFMREIITLGCTVCRNRNYTTTKNKKQHQDKLELSKFCKFCHKHTPHKEIK